MAQPVEQTIRILLLDDHALFRKGLARLLETEAGFEVVSDCSSTEEALAVLRRHPVDVVLLDFDLGQDDGTQFMLKAKEQGFRGKVLLVTAGVERRKSVELIRNGIAAIFMKHNSPNLLAQGIREVMAGKAWFDQELLQAAMSGGSKTEPQQEGFTQRERQVLSYVFEGLANKEIAARMGISENSVKGTLQQLFLKTGVRTRSQLVRIALEQYKSQW